MDRLFKTIVAVACAAVACVSAQAKQLKVLAIGNSFSLSMMDELPKAAAAFPGCELDIANMFIGGCPLRKHWANVEKAAVDPSFRPYSIKKSYAFDKEAAKRIPAKANIPEMLTADRWDIVTIQQASGESPFFRNYEPFAGKLIAKIRELAPQAEIRVHQTWSYSPYDGRLATWRMTPATMHDALKAAYGQLASNYGFRTIPVGDAVALYRARLPVKYGKVLTKEEREALKEPALVDFCGDVTGSSRWGKGHKGQKDADQVRLRIDGSHLNPSGQYLQACVWLAALFDVDVTQLAYEPKPKDFSARAKLMRECAAAAVAACK